MININKMPFDDTTFRYGEHGGRNYSVKIPDFIPYIGGFIYQNRNWNETKDAGGPEPYLEYLLIGAGINILNVFTGVSLTSSIFRGLTEFSKNSFN